MSRSFLAIILATAGAILLGQGIYIHAKAMLAQVLLQRAFTETITTGHAASRGLGPTPGQTRASLSDGSAPARSHLPAAAARRWPSGPAMSSVPPTPANEGSPSIRRIATHISGF